MGWQGLCREALVTHRASCSHDSSTAIPTASLNCIHPCIKICPRILCIIFKATHFTDEDPEAG